MEEFLLRLQLKEKVIRDTLMEFTERGTILLQAILYFSNLLSIFNHVFLPSRQWGVLVSNETNISYAY